MSLLSFLVPFGSCFWKSLDRYTKSSSHFTCAHARDNTSSMILHWYLVISLYRSPSGSMPLLKDVIAVEAFYLGIDTFFLFEACYIDIQGLKLVLSDLYIDRRLYSLSLCYLQAVRRTDRPWLQRSVSIRLQVNIPLGNNPRFAHDVIISFVIFTKKTLKSV